MRRALSPEAAKRIIWTLLLRYPGRRPTMAEIAHEDGQTELQLRRATKDLNDAVHRRFGKHGVTAPFRDFITYGCITYAAELISHGTKVEAAMTLAGFRNWTNFVVQCRGFLGCAPHELQRRTGSN